MNGQDKMYQSFEISTLSSDIVTKRSCRMEINLKKLFFMHAWNLVSVYLLIVLSGNSVSAHVIRTKLGLLEGVTKEARNKKLFHAYYGIPYAKAPTGKLRFEPPVAAGAWSGVFNATVKRPICPQFDNVNGIYQGQEDCLYLNLYTPTNVKPGSNVPVIFYIIGGQFKYGDHLTSDGLEFLMSRDVVIVMVSFRLGVMGYLSTGDTVIPGNMALKDQTLAMKWTKENIYEFGGHPDRITLHGHSSGAAAAHLHTLSPLSEKYFHQIILQSGLGINPQSFRDRDNARGISGALAAQLNCSAECSRELKECLQMKTVRELIMAAEQLVVWYKEPIQIFTPVIEDQNVENAFLCENPLEAAYTSDRKPMLIGMTSAEAAEYVGDYFHPNSSILNINSKLLFPIIGNFEWTSKPSDVDFIAQTLKVRFFGEEDVSDATDITDIALVEILTGIMHGHGLINLLDKYKGSTYAYLFDYRYIGGFTTSKGGREGRFLGEGPATDLKKSIEVMTPINQIDGVSHSDEMPIIFVRSTTGLAEEDFAFGDEIITRWINFVYSGNPNVPFPINTKVFGAWNPVSSPRLEFLRIKNGGSMEKDYLVERFGFWKKIPLFSKYQ